MANVPQPLTAGQARKLSRAIAERATITFRWAGGDQHTLVEGRFVPPAPHVEAQARRVEWIG